MATDNQILNKFHVCEDSCEDTALGNMDEVADAFVSAVEYALDVNRETNPTMTDIMRDAAAHLKANTDFYPLGLAMENCLAGLGGQKDNK